MATKYTYVLPVVNNSYSKIRQNMDIEANQIINNRCYSSNSDFPSYFLFIDSILPWYF